MHIYCTLRGRIKGTASPLSILQRGLREARAIQHGTILLAFLTADKMQSTIKHGKGRAVRAIIMVLGMVSIDDTALGYATLSRPHLSYHYCAYSTTFQALTYGMRCYHIKGLSSCSCKASSIQV